LAFRRERSFYNYLRNLLDKNISNLDSKTIYARSSVEKHDDSWCNFLHSNGDFDATKA
jgi:hypothetical protein